MQTDSRGRGWRLRQRPGTATFQWGWKIVLDWEGFAFLSVILEILVIYDLRWESGTVKNTTVHLLYCSEV